MVETEGIPDGCVLSVRAGATRRQATQFGLFWCGIGFKFHSSTFCLPALTSGQAPVSSDRPFRFNCSVEEAAPFKAFLVPFFFCSYAMPRQWFSPLWQLTSAISQVDVLEPVATARLILRPGSVLSIVA